MDKNGYIIMVERVRSVIFVNEDCDFFFGVKIIYVKIDRIFFGFFFYSYKYN